MRISLISETAFLVPASRSLGAVVRTFVAFLMDKALQAEV